MGKITNGFKYPLHKAGVTSDEIRPARARIYFEGGYAYATDCMVLVRFALADLINANGDLKDLERRSISCESFKALCNTKVLPAICEDGVQVGELLYKTRKEEKPLLGYEAVLKTMADAEPQPTERVKLQAEHIARVGDILDPQGAGLVFELYGRNKAVLVKPSGDIDAIALVMPMYLKDEK